MSEELDAIRQHYQSLIDREKKIYERTIQLEQEWKWPEVYQELARKIMDNAIIKLRIELVLAIRGQHVKSQR